MAGCGPVAREARGEQAGPGSREAAGGRSRGWVTPLGCSCPPTSRSTERVDGRAIGVSVRKALFELGRVILAQQINPLTQKTPIGEAEHCLSNYRGSLQKWEAVQYRYPPDRFCRARRSVRRPPARSSATVRSRRSIRRPARLGDSCASLRRRPMPCRRLSPRSASQRGPSRSS